MNEKATTAEKPGCASNAPTGTDANLVRAIESEVHSLLSFGVSLLFFAAFATCAGVEEARSEEGVMPFTTFRNAPANGVYELKGAAVSSTYVRDSSGNVRVAGFADSGRAAFRITNENNTPSAYDLQTRDAGISFVRGRGDDDAVSNRLLIQAQTGDGQDFGMFPDPKGRMGFRHQTFGIWATGLGTNSGVLSAASLGARTSREAMPGTRKFSRYNGLSLGFVRLPDGKLYDIGSQLIVEISNYSEVSISSTRGHKTDLELRQPSPAPELDFTGTGSLTEDGFVANINGTGFSGTVRGWFYGPRAQEAGMTFRATGPNGVVYAGSFGGKR